MRTRVPLALLALDCEHKRMLVMMMVVVVMMVMVVMDNGADTDQYPENTRIEC